MARVSLRAILGSDPVVGFLVPTFLAAFAGGLLLASGTIVLIGINELATPPQILRIYLRELDSTLFIGTFLTLFLLWPLTLLCSAAGLWLGSTRSWATRWQWWIVVGAGFGAIPGALIMVGTWERQELPLLILGAGCGALTAGSSRRLLRSRLPSPS